jgi:DNA processing protein
MDARGAESPRDPAAARTTEDAGAAGGGPSPLADLLIAANAAPEVGRAPACRLGLAAAREWAAAGASAPQCGRVAAARALARVCGGGAAGDGAAGDGSAGNSSAPRLLPASVREALRGIAAEASARAAAERERAAEVGARLITLLDPEYPSALLDLALPPAVLAVQGEIPSMLLVGSAVAIVGSRRADAYGLEAAAHFGRGLAAAGLTVVSGCARGVDAAAHRAALAAGGTTVAVLGCGLDVDYPRGHAGLRREIAAAGAVLSELPFGAEPVAWHFPVRNRIIAALGRGTLVVQAAARSGSLVTARHALDLGRDVLAVPGSIFDRRSRGTHALLADGACPAAEPRDVLDALFGPSESELRGAGGGGGAASEAGRPSGLPARLLAALPRGCERGVEELAGEAGVGVDRALAALLELELGGWVRRHVGSGTYSRIG